MTKDKNLIAIFLAILAAALYAISTPVSKVMLQTVAPTMVAAFLYLGIGKRLFRGIQSQLPHRRAWLCTCQQIKPLYEFYIPPMNPCPISPAMRSKCWKIGGVGDISK